MIKLAEAAPNTVVRITSVENSPETKRLREIGLIKDELIEVVTNRSGNLLTIIVKGVKWGISKDAADRIEVCYILDQRNCQKRKHKRRRRLFRRRHRN